MSRAAFQPRRADGRSLAQAAFEAITAGMEAGTLTPGSIIPHDEMAGIMGTDYPSSGYFQAVGKASAMLQRHHHRSLQPVRGTGYQLIAGLALVDRGREHQGKASRSIGRAVDVVAAVDESALETREERLTVSQVRRGFAVIAAVVQQQAEILAEHDADIAELKSSRVDDRARLAALEAQLAALSKA